MKYMGSINRIAKHILPIILKDRKEGQWYVEPFVGGANIIDKVTGNRVANDMNGLVVLALEQLAHGWIPPKQISRELYNWHRDQFNGGYIETQHVTGYVGVCGSYNGRFFDGGYAGVVTTKSGKVRNYPEEAHNNAIAQAKHLSNIEWWIGSYDDFPIPKQSLIYCDPPYKGSKEYLSLKTSFNHTDFWQWCRAKKAEGHTIFISEYNAPDDFTCVWEKEVNSSLTKNTGAKKAVEKLFTL